MTPRSAVRQVLAAQERFVTKKNGEIARTHARFDDELLRLQPLWRLNDAPDTK